MIRSILPTLILLAGCETTALEKDNAPKEQSAAEEKAAHSIEPVIPMPSKPLDKASVLTRISFGSCLSQKEDQTIWNSISATDPDLFLFIGDNVYGDVWSGDPHMGELRTAYRQLARSTPFAALREQTTIMPVWDDHDYGLNDNGGSYDLKYGGEALFEEAWALPANDPRRSRDGVYHSEIIGPEGKRVQIILLDTRFFRSDLKQTDEKGAPGKERYLPDPDPAKTMLGEIQYDWLQEELSKPADLRIIVSSVQVIADGHGWEAWATLPTDRQRFYETISASGAEHVLLLSGDRHAGALYRKDGVLPYSLYEATSSSLNLPGSKWREKNGETYIEPGPNRLGTMEYDVNFGQIDIDWEQDQLTLSLLGADSKTLQKVDIPFSDLQIVN